MTRETTTTKEGGGPFRWHAIEADAGRPPAVIRKDWGFAVPEEPASLLGRWSRRETAFVAPGGYSSIHRHEATDNTFRVLFGELFVEVFPDDPEVAVGPHSAGMLHALDERSPALRVPAGVPHRMRAGARGAVVIEQYTCEGDSFAWSIERFSTGGVASHDIR